MFAYAAIIFISARQILIMGVGLKAQTAFEFMVIAIFIMAFITPLWIYLSRTQAETSDQFSLSYAKNAVTQIAKKADFIYSQRMDASVEMEIYIPRGVKEINISGHEINMRVSTSYGETDVFASSIAQLNGTLPAQEGLYSVIIKAEGDYVSVSVA